MNAVSAPTPRRVSPELVVTILIVLAYVVWLLSLPAFPTQDGPIHLYYTHVLRALFSHTGSVYARYYTIKHLLPPYALYYYALLTLSRFVPLLLADRLIVCAYVVSFVFGLRYLARALGPSADTMTLLGTLLLLNWPLGMGFVNFCLSLSFVFWALGLWFRFAGQYAVGRRIAFVFLAILTMFTHPVPLLALLGIAALDLALRTLAQRRRSRSLPQFFISDLITLAAAGLTLGYVKLFTSSRPLQQTAVGEGSGSFSSRLAHNALNCIAEKGLAFLSGPGLELRLYRLLLLLVLIVPLVLAVRQFLRNRNRHMVSLADVTLGLSVLAILILPFAPADLNGSHFFAERLLLLVWVVPLFAASGANLTRRTRLTLLIFTLAAQAVTLRVANAALRPVAETIAAIDSASPPLAAAPGSLGLVLEDPRPLDAPPGLSFNPFLWATVDVFRHDNIVLANTPWLDLAIIPLGATPALPASALPPEALEFPAILRKDLNANASQRDNLLRSVNVLAIDQAYRPPAHGFDALLAGGSSLTWSCRTATATWLRICNR